MAAVIPNIAKGRFVEFHRKVNDNDPASAGFVFVLLQASQNNIAALADHDTLGVLLENGNNTECDFTNYERKVFTDVETGAPVVDDGAENVTVDLPNVTYESAGGAVNNDVNRAVLAFGENVAGADSTLIPCGIFDVGVTTSGLDLIIEFNAVGWARAS